MYLTVSGKWGREQVRGGNFVSFCTDTETQNMVYLQGLVGARESTLNSSDQGSLLGVLLSDGQGLSAEDSGRNSKSQLK